MDVLPPLLFGISASLDALLVGISYGIRGIYIKLWQNLVVSLITLAGTCLSVVLGNRLVHMLPDFLWSILGSMVLMAFGIYYIGKYGFQKLHCYGPPSACDFKADIPEGTNASPSFAAICILGCGLSANNIGIGLSASIAGLSVWSASLVTLFFSVAFLSLGNRLGKSSLLQLVGNYADLLSGLLLVGLGVLELIF